MNKEKFQNEIFSLGKTKVKDQIAWPTILNAVAGLNIDLKRPEWRGR